MSSAGRISGQNQYQNLFEADQSDLKVFKPPKGFNINLPQQHKFSSAYFKDHVDQQYVIYRAFNANNFTYLRNLPDNFRRGQILNDRKQKVLKQTQLQTLSRTKAYEQKLIERQNKINQTKKQKIGTLGYFNKFQYVQSNYEIPKILSTIQRKQSEKKRNQISGLDFRPSGVQAKMKYQDPFQYLQKTLPNQSLKQNKNYLFPFHLPEDTYDQFMQSQRRKRLISESMKLHGDFVPAQNERVLTKPNKQLIGEIIRQIQILLKRYLKEVGFFIGVTKEDYIEVLFEQNQKDMNKISMFMSKICEHEAMCKYILRRNLQKWGQVDKQKGYLIYCILPSWVRNPTQLLERK